MDKNYREIRLMDQVPTCPNCESADVATSLERQTFSYGKESVQLNANVPVHRCQNCDFLFTDFEAEEARDRAIREYLDVP